METAEQLSREPQPAVAAPSPDPPSPAPPLLQTRICDLGLKIEGSPVETMVQRLYRELGAEKDHEVPAGVLSD